MKGALLIVAAAGLSGLWQQITRPTNSAAASARGVSAYESQQYARAAEEFSAAVAARPSPQNIFNLGTAQIAAGERAAGSATLAGAMKDPALGANALYNRGNSALAANAYEHAIRDYTAALKLAPSDRDIKRNLEIALQRKEAQQQRQQSGGQNRQQQAPAPQEQESPQPSPDRGEEKEQGEADAEALLRSVQQQEQEELARMKRARGDSRRVGW